MQTTTSAGELTLELGRLVRYGAALASLAAGIIHLSAAADHGALPVQAGLFVAAGIGQMVWAGLIVTRPSVPVLGAGVLGTLILVGTWVLSRTSGVGFIPGAAAVEPLGFKDAIAVFFELAAISGVGLFVSLPAAGRRVALPDGQRLLIGLTMGSAVAVSLTLGWAPSHGHGGDGDHHHGTGGAIGAAHHRGTAVSPNHHAAPARHGRADDPCPSPHHTCPPSGDHSHGTGPVGWPQRQRHVHSGHEAWEATASGGPGVIDHHDHPMNSDAAGHGHHLPDRRGAATSGGEHQDGSYGHDHGSGGHDDRSGDRSGEEHDHGGSHEGAPPPHDVVGSLLALLDILTTADGLPGP